MWSTSNQPNSMIRWFWHHFGQKGTLGLADSQPFSWGKSTARHLPTICIDYLVFCWERRGKMRIRMDSDGGWWVLNQLPPWLWSQLVGYEVLSSLQLTLPGKLFPEMWSKCWLQLTVDFRGYEAATEWYCTFVHVYRFIIFIIHV